MENGFLTRNQGLDMTEKITGFVKSRTYDRDAIDGLLNDKQDVLNFDNTPTENSTNPVTSGGIKTALDTKQDTLIFDTTPTANSTKPVTSGGVYNAISKPDLYEVNIFYNFTLDELKIPTEYTQVGYAVYKNGEDITNTITNFKTFVDNLNNTNNILKFYSVKSSSVDTPRNHRELLRNYMSSTNFVTVFNVYNSDVVGTISFRADEIACTFRESTIDVVDRIVEDTYGCDVYIALDVTDIPHTDIDLDNIMFANVEDYVQTIKYTKYKINKTSYTYDTEVTYTDSIIKFINNVLPSLNAHYNLSITVDIIKSTGESSEESKECYAEYITHGVNSGGYYDNYLKLYHDFRASGASYIYDYPQNAMQYVGLIVVPSVEYPEATSYCKFARVVDTELTENSNNYITSGTMFDIVGNYYTKSETDNLLNDKQDALTFDTVPTDESENPVTSDGIYNDIHINIAEDSTYESVKTLSNCGAFPMLSLKVSIEPQQSGSGDPSPTNIRPISGWSECKVEVVGKNLVESTLANTTINNNGEISVSGGSSTFDMHIAKVIKGKTYTVQSDESQNVNQKFVGGFFYNIPQLGSISYNNSRLANTPATFTAPIDGYVAFRTSHNYAFAQIELGTTSSTYEPYNGSTITIQLGDTYYGCKLEVVSGVLTVDRIFGEFDGVDENWTNIGAGSVGNRSNVLLNAFPSTDIDTDFVAICNTYIGRSYNDRTFNTSNVVWANPNGSLTVVTDSDIDTAEKFKALLQNTPLQVVVKLATPITYQLTPTQVNSLMGVNNIWANSGDVGDVRYIVKNAASDIITAIKDICYTKTEIDSMIGDIPNALDTINGEVV